MYINIRSLIDVQQSVPYWAIHVSYTFDAVNFAALDAIHACLNACLNYAAMGMASLPAPVQHAFQATFASLQRYCRHLNWRWCTTYCTTQTDLAVCVCVFLFSSFSSSCFFLWWSWCILHWCWWWRRSWRFMYIYIYSRFLYVYM